MCKIGRPQDTISDDQKEKEGVGNWGKEEEIAGRREEGGALSLSRKMEVRDECCTRLQKVERNRARCSGELAKSARYSNAESDQDSGTFIIRNLGSYRSSFKAKAVSPLLLGSTLVKSKVVQLAYLQS